MFLELLRCGPAPQELTRYLLVGKLLHRQIEKVVRPPGIEANGNKAGFPLGTNLNGSVSLRDGEGKWLLLLPSIRISRQQRLTKVKDGLHNPVWKNGFRPTELLRVIQLKNPDQLDVRK